MVSDVRKLRKQAKLCEDYELAEVAHVIEHDIISGDSEAMKQYGGQLIELDTDLGAGGAVAPYI